jgi:CRISPR system Cascade subunit CasD
VKTLVLHLHGPLQSWAGPSMVKTRVDTNRKPSERAIKGSLLAAFGVPRGETITIVDNSSVEVITLRSGTIVRDFQTIGSRTDEEEYRQRVGRVLELGKNPKEYISANGATMVINRTYLGDAAFLVYVNGATDDETEEIYSQLLDPVWSPYLGKRALSPTFPFILGLFDEQGSDLKQAVLKTLKLMGVSS